MIKKSLIIVALTAFVLIIQQTDMTFGATTAAKFSVGAGFNDNVPRQIVRTVADRVYLFGVVVGTGNIKAYWNPNGGYPAASSDFSGSTTQNNPSAVFVTDVAYDGGTIIHVLVGDMAGNLTDYPFDTNTNTFRSGKIISTGNSKPSSSSDIGTAGVSSMFDSSGALHVAYWASSNQIMYSSFTYNVSTDTLTQTSGPTRMDSSGNANHPQLVVSPFDQSVTVAWVNGSSGAGTISARSKPSGGNFGSIEAASTGAVWTSPNSGINIDQGPSMVVTSDGTKAFIYIQNFGSCGSDYGRAHFVSKAAGAQSWTDQTLNNFCTHAPGLAVDNANNFYIIGHGHSVNPTCTEMTQICTVQRAANGTWNNPVVYANPPAGDSLDSSVSVKWSAVGWVRPETIEFVFFDAVGGSYTNTVLWYGRLATTGNESSDLTPPTVSVTTPTEGLTLSGSVAMTASASDNIGVSGVQFKLDSNNLESEDTSSPYSITWNTTTASNGVHSLTAVAQDAAGNQTTSSAISVTVSQPLSGDINADHIVNSLDYSILNSQWFTANSQSDINIDGIVNAIDFSMLNVNWLRMW